MWFGEKKEMNKKNLGRKKKKEDETEKQRRRRRKQELYIDGNDRVKRGDGQGQGVWWKGMTGPSNNTGEI